MIHDDDDGDRNPFHRPVQQSLIITCDEDDDDDRSSFHKSVE